jgi:hypothetical protein
VVSAPTASVNSLRADVAASLRVWRLQPLLPLMSVLVFALFEVPVRVAGVYGPPASQIVVVALVPVLFFYAGFRGTERLWYRRAWEGQAFGAAQAWRASWGYAWRYAGLAFVVGAALIVVVLPSILSRSSGSEIDMGQLIATTVALLVLDFAGTFVTPALAFTTRSPDRAIRIGMTLLWRTFPHNAVYVFVAPLALVLATWLIPAEGSPATVLGLGVVATLFNLLVKGATAAFYLRIAPPAEDGAEPVHS